MAAITGSFSTYDAVGNREDLTSGLYMISPTERPIVSAIGRTKASNTLHEWQTEALASASSTNAALEGVEFGNATSAPTTRVVNYCQISTKEVVVSGTQRAMNHAGIDDMFTHQIMKKGKELLNDVEKVVVQVQGYNAGDATTARKTRALGSFLTTNDSRGTNGADATATTAAPTDGTQRAFTEALLKAVIASCWEAGASPSMLTVGSFNKQAASQFTGRASARQEIGKAAIQGAASMYASDFGDIKIVPSRHQRSRDAFLIDPEYLAMAYLRGVQKQDIAKIGDSDRKGLVVEYALECRNEAAHGVIADLTTS